MRRAPLGIHIILLIYLNHITIDLSINVDELSFAMLIIKQKEELRFILSFYFLNEYILLAFIPSL